MLETSGRLLALLSLLQSRASWSGTELAQRLAVTTRTVRNDIDRLRELGYPVDATRGASGGYRLGIGAKLPPLLLDDEEAIAVAVGLRVAAGVSGIGESSSRALAKLEQVLPHRLQRQVSAIHDATSRGPDNIDSNVEDPEINAATLAAAANAIRDQEWLGFDYRDERTVIEPYRLISWMRRWYLVGREPRSGAWRTFRLDWMTPRERTNRRFTPRPLPGEDYTTFLLRDVASTGWRVHARITVFAAAEEVISRINATVGVVEKVDEQTSVLVTGADSIEIIAVYIGMLGIDFHVTDPPELVQHLAVLGQRYARSVVP
jgi:predicted DNA-binding transcriptional regulator YafY